MAIDMISDIESEFSLLEREYSEDNFRYWPTTTPENTVGEFQHNRGSIGAPPDSPVREMKNVKGKLKPSSYQPTQEISKSTRFFQQVHIPSDPSNPDPFISSPLGSALFLE